MPFTPTQEREFALASSTAISTTMSALCRQWSSGNWLSLGNRYRVSCVANLTADPTPVTNDIREYIAASAILHCFDGWSLLGRALNCELCGDSDSSRHLGYYAELRAAMSLLACEGVGVFSNKHVWVDNTNARFFTQNTRRCEDATHKFTWSALHYWASLPKAVNAIFNTITPGGINLKDWTDNFAPGVNYIASTWLNQWGLDIQRIAFDRDARNLSSYRPSHLTFNNAPCVRQAIAQAIKLWELCEPNADALFPALDRFLLRTCLQQLFRNTQPRNRTHRQARIQFKAKVIRTLHHISPRDLNESQWIEFLTDHSTNTTHPILSAAGGSSLITEASHSREVLARAFLLLRLATGMAAAQLKTAGSNTHSTLKFWWSSSSVRRGLWDEKAEPNSFPDLWADIAEATNDIEQWLSREKAPSFNKLWTECAKQVSVLTTTERAALWGLGL